MRGLTDAYPGKGVEDSEDIEEPQHYDDDYDAIEDRFDAALHGDEAIDKPEQYAYNNERDDDMEEGHKILIFRNLPGDRT